MKKNAHRGNPGWKVLALVTSKAYSSDVIDTPSLFPYKILSRSRIQKVSIAITCRRHCELNGKIIHNGESP